MIDGQTQNAKALQMSEYKMYAIKAIYQNGAVKFIHEPPYKGTFEILIIFPDLSSEEAELNKKLYFQGTKEMDKIMDAEPEWKPEKFIER